VVVLSLENGTDSNAEPTVDAPKEGASEGDGADAVPSDGTVEGTVGDGGIDADGSVEGCVDIVVSPANLPHP
jgi:hypothetical protein